MAWVELAIPRLDRALVPRVSQILFEYGATGVQEEPVPEEAVPPRQPWDSGPEAPPSNHVMLTTWFEDPDPPVISSRLARWLDNSTVASFTWETLPETDWEEGWKEGFKPIRISERLTISPPWCAQPGDVVLEPGCAFGTGAHPSTLACLRQIDALADDTQRVLDVGCGSGILAMAAAKLGLPASGVDIDPTAVAEAKRNAKENGFDIKYATTPVAEIEGTWDLVVCNLFAEAIVELSQHLQRLSSRRIVVAGLMVEKEQLVTAALPWVVTHRESDGTWSALVFQRP
jgi:ribosomal protein L11 methyltransferase